MRLLTEKDIHSNSVSIIKLVSQSYQSSFDLSSEDSLILAEQKCKNLGEYVVNKSAFPLGEFDGEVLIGFVWLYKYESAGETLLHINHIVVDENYRGQGIAKKLLIESEKIAHQLEVACLDLYVSESNIAASTLYDKLDFKTERRYMKKKIGGTLLC